jgi:hypothetical protein
MTRKDIPEANCGYVCATDSFMSGWGPAKGLNNRLIFVCETPEDVDAVFGNCENRSEFKRVTWSRNKPSLNNSRNFYQVKTKEEMPNFYKAGYFS